MLDRQLIILFLNVAKFQRVVSVSYERFIPFSFFVNDKKRKNQLYCLCLKMTADFGNFVAKNDEKRKMKWTRHMSINKLDSKTQTSLIAPSNPYKGTYPFSIVRLVHKWTWEQLIAFRFISAQDFGTWLLSFGMFSTKEFLESPLANYLLLKPGTCSYFFSLFIFAFSQTIVGHTVCTLFLYSFCFLNYWPRECKLQNLKIINTSEEVLKAIQENWSCVHSK